MAKSLSSDLTFLVKFIVFPLSITLFGGGALLAIFSSESIPSEWGREVFVGGMFLGHVAHVAMYSCAYVKLKRVELDGMLGPAPALFDRSGLGTVRCP